MQVAASGGPPVLNLVIYIFCVFNNIKLFWSSKFKDLRRYKALELDHGIEIKGEFGLKCGGYFPPRF